MDGIWVAPRPRSGPDLTEQLKLPAGYFFDLAGRVENQERASRALRLRLLPRCLACSLLLNLALGSAVEALLILGTVPMAFVGGILALAGRPGRPGTCRHLWADWTVRHRGSEQSGARDPDPGLRAEGRSDLEAIREASIGRVRPKLMTAGTATLGLLPLLVLRLMALKLSGRWPSS